MRRSRSEQGREQLLDECYWSPNFEVNRLLGEDAEKFAEKEDFDAKHRLDVALRELPVLVVHGEADPRPVDVAKELAERIPGARFVKMSGVGHWPWLEDPEGLEKMTLEFLQSLI
ncbi:Alpha/Beta hydrolase protein [Endogone sp. FLAS-F59071]|nr:Alpha/Beta hydrolase protein [Endogone sp. FLAS-F59071]|eukprot:RUS14692.1 Alpha/Beta hydrolase protein [Endogone sp. FLAS-F59071]